MNKLISIINKPYSYIMAFFLFCMAGVIMLSSPVKRNAKHSFDREGMEIQGLDERQAIELKYDAFFDLLQSVQQNEKMIKVVGNGRRLKVTLEEDKLLSDFNKIFFDKNSSDPYPDFWEHIEEFEGVYGIKFLGYVGKEERYNSSEGYGFEIEVKQESGKKYIKLPIQMILGLWPYFEANE